MHYNYDPLTLTSATSTTKLFYSAVKLTLT